MKTFDQRMQAILQKGNKEKQRLRSRRILAGTLASVFTVVLALVLFVPYSTALPDVSRYSDSPYYSVIQGLNKATYSPPRYKNNFDFLTSQVNGFKYFVFEEVQDDVAMNMDMADSAPPMAAVPEAVPGAMPSEDKYEEVTDNQVDGVIEADLFKRSDKYLYYLDGRDLYVYSIAKEQTELVGNFDVGDIIGNAIIDGAEMYLSQDCTTITILIEFPAKETGAGVITAVINLDVSDPTNITNTGLMLFEGSYISSRLVEDHILLTYNYGIYKSNIDFGDPETYIPKYGTVDCMELLPAEDILCAQEISSTRYTVVAMLDAKTLEVKDTAALLSYSQELYVSEDTIYATNTFTKSSDKFANTYTGTTMTEITGISYAGDTLEVLGSVQIEGSVKDQYSMDQYDGILRVAASTIQRQYREYSYGNDNYTAVSTDTERNCSLYCIDLATWQIAASVEKFAPAGEEVTSARFDGSNAYICTAEVIVLTDPVYFFDLSDLSNITWTDTGTIDGYSTSLINFGDYLLGIGVGASRGLKLEAYQEGQETVESIGIYERDCSFTEEYKAYFIDRENNLVGIPIQDWRTGEIVYLLTHFNGYKFTVLAEVPMAYSAGRYTRATIVDGWLYVLYGEYCTAQQVW